MDLKLGLRVVRGPDWEWGNLDGGEGHVGTVVEVEDPMNGGRPVIVRWDSGNRCRYRCGVGGKYDLRVLDSAPTGQKHLSKSCRYCLISDVSGVLWQCVRCFEYFLCTSCYLSGRHSMIHSFLRIDSPDESTRVKVSARSRSKTLIKAKGIFPGALVVRGMDWKWGDQDGGIGSTGRVEGLGPSRDTVLVCWDTTTQTNQYRLGLKGKIDLKLSPSHPEGSSVWSYDPNHLPVLGQPIQPFCEDSYAAGDRVIVELDPDAWKSLQEGHGGWNDLMSMFIGSVGVVLRIDDDGDLLVNYESNANFNINSAAVKRVDKPGFRVSDIVRVLDDSGEVAKMQKGHGEWIEPMASTIGQIGKVIKVLPSGDIRVMVAGNRWIYNSTCLTPAQPGEKPKEDSNESHINPGVRMQLDSLMEKKNSALVPFAAAAGDGSMLREFLKLSPNDVNVKQEGKTALHIASAEGFVHIVKILLEYKARVDEADEAGNTPLHVCANLNQAETAELLVGAKAAVDYKNNLGLFPLILATALGHYAVMKVLTKTTVECLNTQDTEGNTALHVAVLSHRIEAVDILLRAGADPAILNLNHFTPLLEASKNGFYAGIERFLKDRPDLINAVKSDDGHTALHIAAANDHLDIVCLLGSIQSCNLNATNYLSNMTPLHLAAQRGYSRIIECLVGLGAAVNAKDSNNNTALHLVLSQSELFVQTTEKKSSTYADEGASYIDQIQDELTALNRGVKVEHFIALACFLVCEGANFEQTDGLGFAPISLCPQEMVPFIKQIAASRRNQRFGGTLRPPVQK